MKSMEDETREPDPSELSDPPELPEPSLPEEAVIEHSLPYGGAPLPPHLLVNRPFLLVWIGAVSAALAFWATLSMVFAEAAYSFDASAGQMAILGVSLSVPFMIAIPFQGMIVDRWSPKWMNLLGYALMAVAIPIAWSADSLGGLYASSFAVGLGFATIEPARSALTGLLVAEDMLVRANGMLSGGSQGAMVVGTLVAGVLLARYGIGTVYATGLVVAVLALVLNLLVPDVRHRGERPSFTLADLARGARTAWERPDLRLLLIVTGAGWMMMNCFFVLEPKFIAEVLKRPEQAVPLIWSAHGGGAILGALLVSKAYDKGRREPVMVALGVAVVGAAILVYVVPALYASAFVGSALMGLGVASVFAPLLAYIQRTVGEEQRGRVTSVYSAIQEGAAVVSSLAILVFSGVIAVAPALTAAGVAAVAAGLLGAQRARRYDGGKTP